MANSETIKRTTKRNLKIRKEEGTIQDRRYHKTLPILRHISRLHTGLAGGITLPQEKVKKDHPTLGGLNSLALY